jgi:hypothetical protein
MRVNGGIIGNSLVPNTIDRSNQSGLFTLDNSLRGYGGALGDSTLKLVGFAEFNTTGAGSYLGSSSQLVNGLQPNDVIYWIMTDAYVGSTSTTTVAANLNNAYNWYADAFREPYDGVSVNSFTNRELAFYDIRRNSNSSRAIVNTDLNTTIMSTYRSYIVTGYGIVTQPGNYRIYTSLSNLPSGSSTYFKHTYAFVFRNVDINRLTTYRASYGLSNPYTPYTRVLLGNSLQLSTSPFAGYYYSDDNFRSLTLPSGNDRDTLIGVVISTYDIVSEWPDYLNSKNRGYYDRKNLGSGYFSMLTTDKFSNSGLTTHAFIGTASDMQLTTYVPGTASTYYPTNSSLYISAYSVMVPSL